MVCRCLLQIKNKFSGRTSEFCLNLIFFFTFPITVLVYIFKKLCCPYYVTDDSCNEEDIDIKELNLLDKTNGKIAKLTTKPVKVLTATEENLICACSSSMGELKMVHMSTRGDSSKTNSDFSTTDEESSPCECHSQS